jgi:L-lactate dehydrogenase complex protein LldG
MEESTSKEKVLKNVRNALISKTEMPFPDIDYDSTVYKESDESNDITFAQAFTEVAGKFVYCENSDELIGAMEIVLNSLNKKYVYCFDEKIRDLLNGRELEIRDFDEEFEKAEVGITTCESLVARTGSIMISSKQTGGRRLNVFPEDHIVIAGSGQLVADISDALIKIKKRYEKGLPSMISMITGPSRTADIEKTMVMGAHGPRNLYVFLVEDLN